MTPKYRPDIDGLRAVAVLSIVFYHLDIKPFTGGFVGVDIFFVISGFLITSIIVRELDNGRFTIANFYERRARRILPALIAMLVVTLAVGLLILSPSQMQDLAQATMASLLFSSNIFFFFESGYFDGASELKPLLHTWSLAVEEQFYIFFPFLLILISRRFDRRYQSSLIIIAILSFVACVAVTRVDDMAAFFLSPLRAWQLLTGSLLAIGAVPILQRETTRNTVAIAGLTLMLISVFAYTHDTTFPGAAALLPTLGTAMVIHAGTGGTALVNRVLSARFLVFVGLISYSLYLWHWPMVVYAKHFLINELSDVEKAVVLLLTFAVSIGSWRFVERPFRNRQRFAPRKRLFTGFATVCGALIVVGFFINAMKGFPGRDNTGTWDTVLSNDPGWQYWKDCEEQGELETEQLLLCSLGHESVAPSFLLWGDSHAMAMASAVNLSADRQEVSGLLAIRTACPPLIGIDREQQTSCAEFNDKVLHQVEQNDAIDTVVLAARWAFSASGERYKTESGKSVVLVDLNAPKEYQANVDLVETGLRRTVTALVHAGKRVVIVKQVPEVGYDVPSANYSAKLFGRDVNEEIAPTREEFILRTTGAHQIIDTLSAEFSLSVIVPSDELCGTTICEVAVDGTPLYRDDHHLSLRGSILIAELFDQAIKHDDL